MLDLVRPPREVSLGICDFLLQLLFQLYQELWSWLYQVFPDLCTPLSVDPRLIIIC